MHRTMSFTDVINILDRFCILGDQDSGLKEIPGAIAMLPTDICRCLSVHMVGATMVIG